MVTGAEILVIAVAIAALTSGFSDGAILVKKLRAKWRDSRERKTKLVELEKLQQSLMQAQSTVQSTFDSQYQRYGQRYRVGDDLARHILFALAARQDALLKQLQRMDFENVNIQPMIASIESTKIAAAKCLQELATRTQRPLPPLQLSLQEKAALLRDYQNLCASAVLYRTGQAPHSQLATISSNKGKSSCHRCGAILVQSKMRIPDADASSCVMINLSGLLRSHCHAGSGWTCIWQLRAPSCYGLFQDEKALLEHMLAVHVRDDRNGVDVKVDWPADIRHGDLQKCGYTVQINGLQMRNYEGNLVVPRQRMITAVTSSSESFLMSGARMPPVDASNPESSILSVVTVEMDSHETEQRYEVAGDERFELGA